MEPTLQSGQYLLVTKASYWRIEPQRYERFAPVVSDLLGDAPRFVFGGPERGDVIVFRYPKDPTRDFIKRVIAIPGDTIEIKQAKVYVNDTPVEEDYLLAQPNYFVERQLVPPNNYFVLGDNRNNSLDSHVWGNVPMEDIIGKAWVRYWPADKWGFIPSSQLDAQVAR